MSSVLDKVLQRFHYERVLISDVTPKRLRVTLEESLTAAKEDQRVFIVLPAILLFKPKILYKLYRDMERFSEIVEFTKTLFSEHPRKKFHGIPIEIFQKTARDYKAYLDQKKSKEKSFVRTFRFTKKDIDLLEKLTEFLGMTGRSQTLRHLIREKAKGLTPTQSLSKDTRPGWRLGVPRHLSSASETPYDR